ncbi:MAG: hypothetical protein KIT56_00270, partial [Gammaproteobacteria bacterium]|nr:hypothetical protein [Gammaproteobacteria bacterium]
MAAPQNNDKYFFVSIVFHIGVLLVLVFSFESSSVMPVFENTNKNDVISAVVLGDSPKSKILPKQLTPQPMLQPVKEIPHPEPQPVKSAPVEMQKDKIALKKAESKKKLAEQRVQEVIKQKDLFGKDLLADIKKLNDKQKKLVQKREQLNFQKVLREQAE